jgi:hypothetical protein
VRQAVLLDKVLDCTGQINTIKQLEEDDKNALVLVMSLCETTSSSVTGRYFSTLFGHDWLDWTTSFVRREDVPGQVILVERRALARWVQVCRLPFALL